MLDLFLVDMGGALIELINLLVGYLVARLIHWILVTMLRRLRFDALIERTGMTGALRGLGIMTSITWIFPDVRSADRIAYCLAAPK